MTVYLAAPWKDMTLAREAAGKLTAAGFTLTSTWYQEEPRRRYSNQEYRDQALRDLAELEEADAIVVLNTQLSEGKAVEFGAAFMDYKLIVVVGKRSNANIFHYLPDVMHAKTVRGAIRLLRGSF